MKEPREIDDDLQLWQADADRLRAVATTARSAANGLARHYSSGRICGCDPDGALCGCRLTEAGYQEEVTAARRLHEVANDLNRRAFTLAKRVRFGRRILATRALPSPKLSSPGPP